MAVDLRSSELENTFIKERISNVEKHTNSICSKFSIYNKKLASLKDSGDDLAKSLQNFISKETLNQSFKFAIHELSDTIASLQNDREAQIQYIEANAIQELKSYGPICKRTKDEFKKSYEAKLLDIKKQNQLQKLQAKDPPDLQKITHAEKEANLAREEAIHAALEMSQRLKSLERKKLENIKHVLLNFIKIEMMFCVKAIEMYTTAYNTMKNIKVDEDLNEFMSHYKALTATLDDQCLSSCDTKMQTESNKIENSRMHSLLNENQRPSQALSLSKTDLLKLNGSNSSLTSTAGSNFDFDHGLRVAEADVLVRWSTLCGNPQCLVFKFLSTH